jgi:hypothetical protein
MFNPEDLATAVDALERAGYITVTTAANGDQLIGAAPKLVELIEERGVTLADIAARGPR